MKKEWSTEDVQKIDELNNKLIVIEEKIYNLAEVEYLRAEKLLHENPDEDIIDYELEVELVFTTSQEQDEYGDDLEFINWNEPVYFKSFNEGDPFGINDKRCHNVTTSIIDNKALNRQKHCWLLHRLYDDFDVSWDDILRIDGLYFDIKVSYQYVVNLEKVKL